MPDPAMASGAGGRSGGWWIVPGLVGLVVAIVVGLVLSAPSPSSPSSPPPSKTVVLLESTLPGVIDTVGSGQSEANWGWPLFNDRPCTNQTVPAFNCTSLDAVLSPGGFYNFSFEVDNGANGTAQVADLETNVNYSYSSVPSQYCNGGKGVSGVSGPYVGAHAALLITMNLTLPLAPGSYNPDLTLVTVLGSCSGSDCSWGC